MTRKLYRRDIVGLGETAHEFAPTFKQETSQPAAIALWTLTKAEQFTIDCSTPRAYDSYEELLVDETIDVVHITVPDKQHAEHILKAFQAGRHVPCEKAIMMNTVELKQALAVAKKNDLVLAEAMTVFSMPPCNELRRLMDTGKFGQLKMIQALSGSYKEPDPKNRFFNPGLAGSVLLDTGIYVASFACWFLSPQPNVLASSMVPFSTSVDEQSVMLPRSREDELVTISLTFQVKMSKQGIIALEDAYITTTDYLRADEAIVHYSDDTIEIIVSGYSVEAMNYETYNVIEATRGTQPSRSLPFTTEVIDILDRTQKL